MRYTTDDFGAWERWVSERKIVASFGRHEEISLVNVDAFEDSVCPFPEGVKGSVGSDASSLLQSLS